MTARGFALRDTVVIDEYKRFATSFTAIHAPDIKAQVEAIYAEERYWPEPLIQINPSYKRSADIKSLVAKARSTLRCADIFQTKGDAAHALQAPGAGHRARRGWRELRRHHRHRLRQVALLLHPHRAPVLARSARAAKPAPAPSSSTR
jgi:hypothetical protein